ncbi:SDR family oxidoreductase [Nitratireductor sp. GISD-1A_MAKvit]|uniref:SDR family NAD(P)-dependent oxidoreductase n=1 Tax=Nitratireductor sp. GISD-1A_MAKvit TaxID=3234198 RepID=UPI0034670DF5
MNQSAKKRVILITGTASGIGAACARTLAAPDTALVLTTRSNEESMEKVADECRQKGASASTIRVDLTSEDAAETLVNHALDTHGGLDQIVSNAGKGDKRRFGEFDRADLHQAFELNTVPFLELVNRATPHLEKSTQARIVFISSFVTYNIGVNDTIFPLTAASKAATEGLAGTLAYQLASKGITVNGVAPGYTRKEGGHAAISPEAWKAAAKATPSGRIAEPADIAAAVAFFLSEGASHVTGQILRVDGGLSLV